MNTVEVQTVADQYIDLWHKNADKLHNKGSEEVNEKRKPALDEFEKLGIPHKKMENYKYTDLTKNFRQDLEYRFEPEDITFQLEDIFKCDIPELDTYMIILLNGFYYEKLNTEKSFPKGVILDSFDKASKKYPEIFKEHYGKYAEIENNPLTALNTSFVQDGVFMHVPKNVKPDKPFQIINLLMSEQDLMVQHRNLFVFEEGSNVDLVICDHTLSGSMYLTNSVTELVAKDNAHINYSRMQNEHNGAVELSNLFIHQEKDSSVNTNTVTLHGGMVRNNVNVNLNGEGASNKTNGIFLTDNNQHVDSFTWINHNQPNCLSDQLFKGILSEYSTGGFTGRIYVAQDAQKTLAYQRNNNILLSDYAKMNSKPQLEIYADDVKCSHGATMGQLDESAIFYMQSRGIKYSQARLLMMNAFAHEVIDQITIEPLKERLGDLVEKRLRGELSSCNNCPIHCEK